MSNDRVIIKLKKKLQSSPENMKSRFKLIDFYIGDDLEQLALECIKEGLQTVKDTDPACKLFDKADELLTNSKNINGEQFFQELSKESPNPGTGPILQFFTGKQIVEEVSKNHTAMESRDVARRCMEATEYLKDAVSTHLPDQYQFSCQLALARASYFSGNIKGALEKLEKMESSYSMKRGTENKWGDFYHML